MFGLEKDMAPVITSNLETISDAISTKPGIALAYELPVKYRFIDIAIVYALPERYWERIELYKSLTNINGILIEILSVICSYPKITLNRLQKELFMDYEEIKGHLNKLMKYNLIQQVSKTSYKATGWADLGNLGIISIELKLCNWKEALEQAEYNLLFSDFSYVALDKSRISNRQDLLTYFQRKNIGLLSVNENGEIEPLLTPKRNKRFDKRLYIAQRIKILQDMLLKQKWQHIKKQENV